MSSDRLCVIDHPDVTEIWKDPEPSEVITRTSSSFGVSRCSPGQHSGQGALSTGDISDTLDSLLNSPFQEPTLSAFKSPSSDGSLFSAQIAQFYSRHLWCNILLSLDRSVQSLDRPICLLPRTRLCLGWWLRNLALKFRSSFLLISWNILMKLQSDGLGRSPAHTVGARDLVSKESCFQNILVIIVNWLSYWRFIWLDTVRQNHDSDVLYISY